MSRLAIFLLYVVLTPIAYAQNSHVHEAHSSPTTQPEDHSAHMPTTSGSVEPNSMAHDHSAMTMESDVAPANARDPHAYSAGYTHDAGPYAYTGPNPLMLADEHTFMSVLADRVEYSPDSNESSYEIQAWRGDSFNRLVFKTQGDFARGGDYENQSELLWGHAFSAFWDSQFGLRVDTLSEGKNRQWLAAGIQGLAPYWFELSATVYVSGSGQSELAFDSEYDLLLTQRLILQPRLELTVRGKNDIENQLGSGLSDASIGLRLRYEFSRQLAPFVGIEFESSFGDSAKFLENAGEGRRDTRYFAGVRFWF